MALNKQSLIEFIADYNFYGDKDVPVKTKKVSAEFLEDFLDLIQSEVVNGGEVSIPGFGKFSKFTSPVTEKSKPKFTAFARFKDIVN